MWVTELVSTAHLSENFNGVICNAVGKNNIVLSLFIDRQKVLDTIDHELLFVKLILDFKLYSSNF